jgi:hypothetical protein
MIVGEVRCETALPRALDDEVLCETALPRALDDEVLARAYGVVFPVSLGGQPAVRGGRSRSRADRAGVLTRSPIR